MYISLLDDSLEMSCLVFHQNGDHKRKIYFVVLNVNMYD